MNLRKLYSKKKRPGKSRVWNIRRTMPQICPRGVCVFDIDCTINRHPARVAKIVAQCKRNGYAFAINTARPTGYTRDIDFPSMGLPTMTNQDPHFCYNPHARGQTGAQHGQHKLRCMQRLQRHFLGQESQEGRARMILFDDKRYNTDEVNKGGYKAIRVGSAPHFCGFTEEQVQEAPEWFDQV